ncbi:hypothetical protein B0H13DRAFT_2419617 [Mycena leptocephala]|nr:hypothetical protein B0H13DRAFT_2419617 [Mycena leptocephala]
MSAFITLGSRPDAIRYAVRALRPDPTSLAPTMVRGARTSRGSDLRVLRAMVRPACMLTALSLARARAVHALCVVVLYRGSMTVISTGSTADTRGGYRWARSLPWLAFVSTFPFQAPIPLHPFLALHPSFRPLLLFISNHFFLDSNFLSPVFPKAKVPDGAGQGLDEEETF